MARAAKKNINSAAATATATFISLTINFRLENICKNTFWRKI